MKLAHTAWGDFEYWDNDGIGEHLSLGRFWDEHFRAAFDEARPGSVIVDAGAHFGCFTVYAARKPCHVFAFEPCPEVFALLRSNVERNNLGIHVSMFPLALHEKCTELRAEPLELDNPALQSFANGHLNVAACRNSGTFRYRPGSGSAYDTYAVPLDYFHLRGVSLIKVDTEGCDLFVLKGAVETIRVNRPILCYEWLTVRGGSGLKEFGAFIESIGYEATQVHEANEGTYKDFVARPK